MNCPACNVTLKRSERQGIEIDFCPRCRGVWLDRGELDKIIDLAGSEMAAMTAAGTSPACPSYPSDAERREDHRDEPLQGLSRRKRFLRDLFD